jgi:hypothetical protein
MAFPLLQVSAGAFETAGLRGEDNMEDFHLIASTLQGAGPHAHLMGAVTLLHPARQFDDCLFLIALCDACTLILTLANWTHLLTSSTSKEQQIVLRQAGLGLVPRALREPCACALRAGVFDGHRGRSAAAFAAEHFPEHLRQQWRRSKSPEAALRAAFLSLDEAFRQQQVCCSAFHGCTLVGRHIQTLLAPL